MTDLPEDWDELERQAYIDAKPLTVRNPDTGKTVTFNTNSPAWIEVIEKLWAAGYTEILKD